MREQEDEKQLADQPVLDSDPRISIWTIRAKWIGWFYMLFALHAAPLIYALWWSENYSGAHDNIASTITAVVSGSASLIFVAAVATIIELEAVMVLREWYRERAARKRAEARQKGREEGHQRGYKEGFEAGRKAEREAQAVSSGNSSDRNGTDK